MRESKKLMTRNWILTLTLMSAEQKQSLDDLFEQQAKYPSHLDFQKKTELRTINTSHKNW